MVKDNFKIFLCLFAYTFFIASAYDDGVAETGDLSRSFTFAALVNTSSSLDSEDDVLERHKARSAVHCAQKCLTNRQCKVIGFNAKSGVCWLMKSAGRNGVLTESRGNVILIKVGFEKAKEEKVVQEEFASCKEVLEKGKSKGNGIYNIKTNQTSPTRTYCHMDTLPNCGDGGWTLTMKIDGSKDTFGLKSSYWKNRQALKTENGLGLENKESKLPTYWSTPLNKICLGMKLQTSSDIKWLKLELKQRTDSLYDVITTGYPNEPYTLLGFNKWYNTFIPSSGYSTTNTFEGVSIARVDKSNTDITGVRLGVLYLHNGQHQAYLGFGTWGYWHDKYGIDVSCGYGRISHNYPHYKKYPAFCYILVQ